MAMPDGFNNPKPSVLFHKSSKDLLPPKPPSVKTFKSQLSKGESRKTLVRNSELVVYPTTYKSDVPVTDVKEDREKPPSAPSSGLYKTNLAAPCLNSALRLVREMKQTSKAKPSNTHCAKLLDEGKVLQQVNFLYEEHLYHDLVALNVSDVEVHDSNSARLTTKFRVREKDKEPQLSQFFAPSFSDEYHIPIDPPQRVKQSLNARDSFSVYQRMRSWDLSE